MSSDIIPIPRGMHDDVLFVHDAFEAGARGYVTKYAAPDELIDCVAPWPAPRLISDPMPALVRHDGRASSEHPLPELTTRGVQVFVQRARGHAVAKVAAPVGVSTKAAYGHRSTIYAIMRLFSDHDLRILAAQRGLIEKR